MSWKESEVNAAEARQNEQKRSVEEKLMFERVFRQELNREEERQREENRMKEEKKKELRKKYPIGGKGNDLVTMAIQGGVGLVVGLGSDIVYLGKLFKKEYDAKKEMQNQGGAPEKQKENISPAMERYKAHEKANGEKVQARAQSLVGKTKGRDR